MSAKPTINACTQYRCRDLPSRLKLTVRFWLTRTFCRRVALALDLYYQKAHEMGSAECVLGIERCPFPTAGCIRLPFIQACLSWLLMAESHLTPLAEKGCDVFTLARVGGHLIIAITQRYVQSCPLTSRASCRCLI